MEKTGLEDFHFFNFLKEEDLLRLKEISVKKYFNKEKNINSHEKIYSNVGNSKCTDRLQ